MPITAEDIIKRREEEEAQQQARLRDYMAASAPEGVDPEVLNAMYAMADEVTAAETISKKRAIIGTTLGVGTEIGGSIAGGIAWSRYMNAVRIANAARAAGSAGVVTPEPVSTAIGAGVFLAGEAAIGAASNIAGQQIRKAYGLQDKTSWGEVAAASVFNLTVVGTGIDKAVAKAGEKVFKIHQPSLQSMKAWKRKDLLVFGATKSVSGAAMGLSESVLRQEVEILLNDRENRDTYDYLLSAGFGAGFNSLFNLWGKTGAWGRKQATKVFETSVDSLKERLATAQATLADLQQPLPSSVTSNPWASYANSARIGQEMAIRTKRKEIEVIEEALELMKDGAEEFSKADIEATKADLAEPTEPAQIKDPGEFSQPELPPIQEEDFVSAPQATPDAEGVTPPVEQVKPVTESAEELKNPIYVDEAREKTFLDIYKRSQLVKPDSSTHQTNLQSVTKALRDLQSHTEERILHLVNELHKDAGNQSVAKELSNEINFLRKVNLNTGYALEFMAGGGVRGFRADDPAAVRLATPRKSPYFIQNPENPQYKQISQENIDEDEALESLLELVNETAKTGRTPDELAMRETLESITAPKAPEEAVEPIIDVKKMGETAEEIIQKPEAKPTRKTKKAVKKPIEDLEKSQEDVLAKKLLEQQQKAASKLDEQIEELRKKVFDEPEETKAKLKKQLSAEVQEKLRVKKFYQDAIKENEKYIQRLQQRKEIIEAEGRGVMSEMRGITAKKPKGPTKTPGRLQKLEKEIRDSKKRMAQKLRDIDKAANKIKDEEFIKLLYNSYLNTAITGANRNKFGAYNSAINWYLSARRMAMIDQLPSVAAAVPAGIGVGIKQTVGFIPEFIFTAWKDKSISKASKMALADLHGTMAMFSSINLKEMLKYSARTFVEGRDITNKSAMKYFDHHGRKTGTRLMQKAYADAMARDKGVTNITNYLLHTILNGKIMDILSIGARGIGVMDGLFQRQLLRGRMYSDSLKQAVDLNPDANFSELKEIAEKNYKKQWVDDDGVAVLSSSHDQSIVNQVEIELLKAANTDDIEGTVTALIEKGIKVVEDRSNTSVRALMSILMPFLGVGVRGTFRGIRLSIAPLRAFKNPHNPKLDSLRFEQQALIDSKEVEGLTPEAKRRTEEEIKTVAQEITRVQKLRNDYNLDILKDTMMTIGLGTVGYLAGRYGYGTGSLAWMSDEQKRNLEKNTKKFNMLGVEYTAAAPFNFPFAAAADLGMYHRLKELERTENKKFLTSDQDLFSVAAQSFLELLKDQPITSSIGDITDMVSGSREQKARAQSRFVSSFFLVPAQIRKFVRQWEESGSGTVADMKGASFQARIVYNALGHGAQAKRTDRFGEDIQPTGTWFSTNVMRQFPQKFQTLTKLEEYILADSGHNNISYKPSTIAGIDMASYVDAEGVPLWYHYDLRLRETRINRKTLLETLEQLVSKTSWQRKFNKGFIQSESRQDRYENEGLLELNKIFSKYYKQVKDDILKDKEFLSQFVDQKDRSLFDVIGRMTGAQPENLLEKIEEQKKKGKVGVMQWGIVQELRK